MSWRGRLIAEDYSALTQQTRSQFDYWQQLYWGRLRLDSIIARTLVVPDSYLIDGRFFMSTSPTEMAKKVGRDESATSHFIEIRSRRPDLQLTLKDILVRPGEKYLNRFRVNSIVIDADREILAERLSTTEVDTLQRRLHATTPDRAVGSLLADLSRDLSPETQETIELLERGWNRWLNTKQPGIVTRPWDRSMSVLDGLELEHVDPEDLNSVAAAPVLRDVVETVRRSNYQSEIETVLNKFREEADELLREDLEAIWRWYRRGRHRAMGLQHQCSVAHLIVPGDHSIGNVEPLAADPPLDAKYFVEAPEGLLTELSGMPADEFTRFVSTNIERIQKWHTQNSRSALRAVISSLESSPAFLSARGKSEDYLLDIFSDVGPKLATQSNAALSVPGFIMTLAAKPFKIWRNRSFARRVVDYCVTRTASKDYG